MVAITPTGFILFLFFFFALPADQAHVYGHLAHHSHNLKDDVVKLQEQQRRGLSSSSSSSIIKAISNSKTRKCEPTYGVMPCTGTVTGNLFLMLAYGYILYRAARLLLYGSELLVAVLNTGIIGGLLLPVLGTLPDSLLVLVSGLGGDKAEAQQQILVGIGLLAGSIVMLLTLLWGSCLFYGRCDLERRDGKMVALDRRLTRGYHLTGTGVETDDLTKYSARIMIAVIIPFIVVQIPRTFHMSVAASSIFVLSACIMLFCGLAAYCLYQVSTPWIQNRRKLRAQKMAQKLLAIERFLRPLHDETLFDRRGHLNKGVAKRVFQHVDMDKDENISLEELRVILGVSLSATETADTMIKYIMEDFDKREPHGLITLDEFVNGLEKWSKDFKLTSQDAIQKKKQKVDSFLDSFIPVEEVDDDEGKLSLSKGQVIRKAMLYLFLGTVLAAVFADPLIDAVHEFSIASHIPSFFVSFVLLPIASNASEAVSSIVFASRKKKVNMSLTYSQIYGAVTLNSTLGLGIFLALVYARGLSWNFSSEVVVICLVVVIMGVLAAFRNVFPLWMGILALFLYPMSLGIVAILDYLAGWE